MHHSIFHEIHGHEILGHQAQHLLHLLKNNIIEWFSKIVPIFFYTDHLNIDNSMALKYYFGFEGPTYPKLSKRKGLSTESFILLK